MNKVHLTKNIIKNHLSTSLGNNNRVKFDKDKIVRLVIKSYKEVKDLKSQIDYLVAKTERVFQEIFKISVIKKFKLSNKIHEISDK